MTGNVGFCRQRPVLRRLHRFPSPFRYAPFPWTTITSTEPGPWTPIVSTSSRSADRDGPLTQTRLEGNSVPRQRASARSSTMVPENRMQMCAGGTRLVARGAPGPQATPTDPLAATPAPAPATPPGAPPPPPPPPPPPEHVIRREHLEPRLPQPPRHPQPCHHRIPGRHRDG